MSEQRVLDICEQLLECASSAGADEAEAVAAHIGSTETHLENDDVHVVQTREETSFGLRVYKGGRLGFVTANDVSERSLSDHAAEAVEQARSSPPAPFAGLPEPRPIRKVDGLFNPALGQLGVDDTTRMASARIERVHGRDGRVRIDSGSLAVSSSASAIASTRGIRASEKQNSADLYLFGMAVDGDEVASFDYDSEATRDADRLAEIMSVAATRFADKCSAGLGAHKGRSFRGGIVLSPEAVCELILGDLTAAICADNVRKGRSPLAEKLGKTIASPLLWLSDDGTRTGGLASSAFDREGVPTARLPIIEDGVLRSFLWNHYEATAAANGSVSTGHAAGGVGSLPTIGPLSLEIAAGDETLDDLYHPESPSVLVNRFSGSSNAVTGDFSGVVKNGFLLGEGDPIPIKETLIAGNLFSLLEHISAISRERRLIGGSRWIPTIRSEDVSVTAG